VSPEQSNPLPGVSPPRRREPELAGGAWTAAAPPAPPRSSPIPRRCFRCPCRTCRCVRCCGRRRARGSSTHLSGHPAAAEAWAAAAWRRPGTCSSGCCCGCSCFLCGLGSHLLCQRALHLLQGRLRCGRFLGVLTFKRLCLRGCGSGLVRFALLLGLLGRKARLFALERGLGAREVSDDGVLVFFLGIGAVSGAREDRRDLGLGRGVDVGVDGIGGEDRLVGRDLGLVAVRAAVVAASSAWTCWICCSAAS